VPPLGPVTCLRPSLSKLSMEVVRDRNPIVFHYRMCKKLQKIVQKIEVMITKINTFGFRHLQQVPPSKLWQRTNSILVDYDKDINCQGL
jgi:hypothetical protein